MEVTSLIKVYGTETKKMLNILILEVLRTYSDDEHIGDKEIPMVYIEFPKLFNSNNNYLSVEWHEDGVLKVE